jgi:hypothetical protein
MPGIRPTSSERTHARNPADILRADPPNTKGGFR